MLHPYDLARITRDWNAGYYANDNSPWFDESEGLDEWLRESRRTLARALLWALYAAAVVAGCVVAFHLGHAAGGAL